MLTEALGLVGVRFEDTRQSGRYWTIVGLFAPLPGRALGGIRAKVQDDQGFISFVNQRDLELILNLARPGQWCDWMESPYPGINDDVDGWYGICCDEQDLLDDLHEREMLIRAQNNGWVPLNYQLTRRIHLESRADAEEILLLVRDMDPDTGYAPDPRLETILGRWVRVERTRCRWTTMEV